MCSIPVRLFDKIQDKILTPVLPDNVLVPTSGFKQSKEKSDMLPQNSGNQVATYAMQHPRTAETRTAPHQKPDSSPKSQSSTHLMSLIGKNLMSAVPVLSYKPHDDDDTGGGEVQFHTFLMLAQDGNKRSAAHPNCFTQVDRVPTMHWVGGYVALKGSSGHCGEDKDLQSCP
jgi:hypothetical protein